MTPNNTAATGLDCPYTGHGPDSSLDVCKAACVSAGGAVCTDINYNPFIPDCVFRKCVDPNHPNATPAPGYQVFAVSRPIVTSFGVSPPATFAFKVAPGSFSSPVLEAALARASSITFPYGPGSPSTLPGPTVSTLTLTITTSTTTLTLGVDESYYLSLDPLNSNCTLTAPTIYGAMRGLETFAQLVSYSPSTNEYSVEEAVIQDSPRFPYRGVMIDASRHFISVSVMKDIVELLASLKLNALSIHFNDDNSWPLFIPSWPNLTGGGAYSPTGHIYSPSAMADLVAFAASRGVRIIPEFDSPSHFGTLGASYPQFAAVTKDGGLCMVDPSKEATFDFLGGVFKDMAAMFPDHTVRIGGDEFQGCWGDCPEVMSWIASKWGVNGTIEDAYHYYVRRLVEIQRGLGKASMAWLDVAGFPDSRAGETWAKDYPDVTLNVWTGCYSGSWQNDVSRFVEEGGRVVVSGPFYITDSATPHFTWEQMYQVDLGNFTGNTTAGMELVAGGELCAWDDAVGSDSGDLAMQLTPYILGVAEAWWSPQAATSGKAPDAMRAHHHRCRLGQRGHATHPIFAFGTYCPVEYQSPQYKGEGGEEEDL